MMRLTIMIVPLALTATANVQAQQRMDARDLQMLPPYCKYTQIYRSKVPGGDNLAEIKRWTKIMGHKNFAHMHHYCWGLEATHEGLYFERSKLGRDRKLTASISEFQYVIRNVEPDFAMLPEILTKQGQNLILLDRAPEALPVLNRAIDLNRRYWPPYAALGDYYRDLGDSAKAREWLEKGLKEAPEANALKRRLADLSAPKGKRKTASEQ
jgi:tetratricopeptide (TPR) repeat protein